jgi:hypothetical protein
MILLEPESGTACATRFGSYTPGQRLRPVWLSLKVRPYGDTETWRICLPTPHQDLTSSGMDEIGGILHHGDAKLWIGPATTLAP